MDTAVETPRTTAAPRQRRPGRILRGIGKTFLTAAFILAAYIAWLLWGTGFYYGNQQDGLREQIESRIEAPGAGERGVDPVPIVPGQAYAILQIPSIGLDEVVVQGTDTESLHRGPGHYEDTADPWDERGRVGIAGHRTTYGQPFWDLDKVEAGDPITLVTQYGVFEYVTTRTETVLPSSGGVLTGGGKKASLVLTTCHPKFSAAERLIVFAELAA